MLRRRSTKAGRRCESGKEQRGCAVHRNNQLGARLVFEVLRCGGVETTRHGAERGATREMERLNHHRRGLVADAQHADSPSVAVDRLRIRLAKMNNTSSTSIL